MATPCSLVRLSAAFRPESHATMITPIMEATSSGTQPPSVTRRMLAPKKMRSMVRKGTNSRAVQTAFQCHRRQAMIKARQVVTTIVPVTAIP